MNRQQSIAAAITVIVMAVLGIAGVNVSEELVTDVASAFITLAAFAVAIWKNYNFTDAALKGQAVINAEKNRDEGEGR